MSIFQVHCSFLDFNYFYSLNSYLLKHMGTDTTFIYFLSDYTEDLYIIYYLCLEAPLWSLLISSFYIWEKTPLDNSSDFPKTMLSTNGPAHPVTTYPLPALVLRAWCNPMGPGRARLHAHRAYNTPLFPIMSIIFPDFQVTLFYWLYSHLSHNHNNRTGVLLFSAVILVPRRSKLPSLWPGSLSIQETGLLPCKTAHPYD